MVLQLVCSAALAAALAADPQAGMPPPTSTTAPTTAPVASPARLRPIASDKPVTVDANEVRFNWTTRQVKVVGKPTVSLRHDDATLTCRVLTGENDPQGRLARATCEGDVRLVRGPRTVTCERASYDRAAAVVVCQGRPLLKDGDTEVRGDKLTWDLGADEVRLEGNVQGTVPGALLDFGTPSPGSAAPDPATAPRPAAAPSAAGERPR